VCCFVTRWQVSDLITASVHHIDTSMVESPGCRWLLCSGMVCVTPVPYGSGDYGCGKEQRFQLLLLDCEVFHLRWGLRFQHRSDRKVMWLLHRSFTLHLIGKYDCTFSLFLWCFFRWFSSETNNEPYWQDFYSTIQAFSCPYHTFKGLLVAYRSGQNASYVLRADNIWEFEVPYSLMFVNMLLQAGFW